MIKYSDNPLMKLKEVSPLFYKIYNLSVLMSYIGFVAVSWYFINLAYTINTPSYDILCAGCTPFSHFINVLLLVVWLFFLYFYIVNEIRFRFAHYANIVDSNTIRAYNLGYVILVFVFTLVSFYIIK